MTYICKTEVNGASIENGSTLCFFLRPYGEYSPIQLLLLIIYNIGFGILIS